MNRKKQLNILTNKGCDVAYCMRLRPIEIKVAHAAIKTTLCRSRKA